MTMQNFVEALSNIKRRSRLAGRPADRTAVRGISEGYFAGAADRLAKAKGLALQERGLGIQERGLDIQETGQEKSLDIAERSLSEQIRTTNLEHEAALRAEQREEERRARRWYDPTAWCIIVTACTDRYSPEVEITRMFRDRFLSPITLKGYYTFAPFVAYLMSRIPMLKHAIKYCLVDRLIDYGSYALGIKASTKFRSSKPISIGFLKLCRFIGRRSKKGK